MQHRNPNVGKRKGGETNPSGEDYWERSVHKLGPFKQQAPSVANLRHRSPLSVYSPSNALPGIKPSSFQSILITSMGAAQ